ncbi:MAG TPA: hypothetical protein VFT12_05515, partial [Thermoanaerobaculia bacterium]|nr:hypothetical protein [Thermoanaerobaculia bacterium]
MFLSLLLAIGIAAPDLRLELERESLTGTHRRYRQFIDGIPVVGGEVNVTIRPDGTRDEQRRLAIAPAGPRAKSAGDDLVWVNVDGVARLAIRDVVLIDSFLPVLRYREPATRAVLREEHRYVRGKPAAVFDPNPVAKLNAPQLRVLDDSPSAVPEAAYSLVELQDVNDAGPLGGPW